MSKIEKFILNLVDNIMSDPESYKFYVEKTLSPYRSLPYPGEDISRETIKKIIASTKWEKIEEASCKPEPL